MIAHTHIHTHNIHIPSQISEAELNKEISTAFDWLLPIKYKRFHANELFFFESIGSYVDFAILSKNNIAVAVISFFFILIVFS